MRVALPAARVLVGLGIVVCVLSVASGFELTRRVFSSGATTSSGSTYGVQGTVAETGVIGTSASGATYGVEQGFWPPVGDENSQPGFAEVGASAGTDDASDSRGAAWGDYDADGDLDLYVSNWGSANRFYLNNGDGTFTEQGAATGTNDAGLGTGVAWGDYDNDGDLDLYLANQNTPNRLYRNEGDGTFTDVGPASGTDDAGSGRSVSWSDFDDDGDLDLYLVNYSGVANRLFQNEGDGTFTDVGATSGTDDLGSSVSATWGDYDNDGDPDLYLSNHLSANRLYRNDGGGMFTDVAAASGTADLERGRGTAWGDYDNDGDLDLYVVNFDSGNLLYRNEGDGTFTEVGASSGTSDLGSGRHAAWGDYDNDGHLDLYLTNSGDNRLFRNPGDGTFAEVSTLTGAGDSGDSFSATWGDYDLDGDLDLYVANGAGANRLYRNDSAANPLFHWLHVDLVGTLSNRSGIGARLRCVSAVGVQLREVSAGSGLYGENSLTVEFGLATATTADTLEITWPSGVVQILSGIAADQRITVVEDDPSGIDDLSLPSVYALHRIRPNPSGGPLTEVEFDLPVPSRVRLSIYDVSGRRIRTLVANERLAPGRHVAHWDGRSDRGDQVGSGVYFTRIETANFRATRRLVRLE